MAGRYFNRQGGVSRCLAELSDRASAGPDEVTVFASEILDEDGSGARFVKVPMIRRPRWAQSVTFAAALQRRLDRSHFDLVHVHNAQGLGADIYTAHSCHRAYIELRRAEGGPGAVLSRVYPPHVVDLWAERHCLRSGDPEVIALTPRIKSELERHLGLDPRRIHVIPNGVDTRSFAPPVSRDDARAEAAALAGPVEEEDIILLFAGYEFHRKGLRQVIDSMALVGDPRVRLWVAGGAAADAYRRRAAEHGLGERVSFLGHVANLAPLYQAADLFVFPTVYEPFGLVILEALACGLPVVTSSVAGTADFMTDGEEGLLLDDPTDPAELADALKRVILRDGGPERMRGPARALAETLDWDVVWRRTRELYVEVAEAPTGSRLRRRAGRGTRASGIRPAA